MPGKEHIAASIGGAVGGVFGAVGGFFIGGVGAVPGAAAGSAGGAATAVFLYEILGHRMERAVNAIGPELLDAAFLDLGLDLKSEDGLNDETITAAINKAFLNGSSFQLASVFDKEKMVAGFRDFGLQKLSSELGLGPDGSNAEIVENLRGWITEELIIQLGKQAGEIYDAAKERIELNKKLKALGPVDAWNKPVDLSAKGVANRGYQAKFRRNHKKHWEPK